MQLREAAFVGFRLQLYLKVFSVALHQVGSVVLAIILTPSDFAIVGLAMVFVGICAGVADFGLGSALIQRQSESDEALRTGATLRFAMAFCLVLGLAAMAPLIASIYAQPGIRAIIWLLSLLLILNFAGFMARVSLTKALKFRQVFVPEIAGSAATSISSIALALAGFSYWSLVAGYLVGALTNAAILYAINPWKPGWHLNRQIARELLRFGSPIVAGSILLLIFQNVGVAALGIFRFNDLGFYLYASSWAVAIPLGLHTSVDNVMFPVYSAMKLDRARIRRAYLMTMKQVVRAIAPGEAFLIVASPTFVVGLVGTKWSAAIPMLTVLGAGGFLYTLSLPYLSVAVSLGRPREVALFNAIGAAVMVPLGTALSFYYGGFGLSWAFALTSAVMFAWALLSAHKVLGDLVRTTTRLFAEPIVSALALSVPVGLLQLALPPSLTSLALEGITALAVYASAMVLLTKGQFVIETREVITAFLNR